MVGQQILDLLILVRVQVPQLGVILITTRLRDLDREGSGEKVFPVEEGLGKPWVSQGPRSRGSRRCPA